MAGRPNLQKITEKKSRLRRAKSLHFPVYMPSKPQKFRACGGQNPSISPCIRPLKPKNFRACGEQISCISPCMRSDNPIFFHACSEPKHSLYSGKRCPIARRRRENFWGLEVCTRGNPSDLARRRRENFDIRSGPDPKSQILRFETEGGVK